MADLTGYDQLGRARGFYAMSNDLGATLGPFFGARPMPVTQPSLPISIMAKSQTALPKRKHLAVYCLET